MKLGFNHIAVRGFTLVELLVGVAVFVILASLAAPSMQRMIETQRVRGVGDELITDLQWARSEALRRGAGDSDVALAFGSNGELSCYSIHAGNTVLGADVTCDCTRAPGSACAPGGVRTELKTVQVARATGVVMAASSASGTELRFQPPQGLPTPTSLQIEVAGSRGGRVRASTNGVGRPSLCSPAASVSGVQSCD
jgi:type IV fimbrial biogenesis protein FimT